MVNFRCFVGLGPKHVKICKTPRVPPWSFDTFWVFSRLRRDLFGGPPIHWCFREGFVKSVKRSILGHFGSFREVQESS